MCGPGGWMFIRSCLLWVVLVPTYIHGKWVSTIKLYDATLIFIVASVLKPLTLDYWKCLTFLPTPFFFQWYVHENHYKVVSLVINYDLLNNQELYIRRIGRSSRFGRKLPKRPLNTQSHSKSTKRAPVLYCKR